MKFYTVILLGIMSTNLFAAVPTSEFFHQADKKEILLESGYSFFYQELVREVSGGSDTTFKGSRTTISLDSEYGINEMLAIGLNLAHHHGYGDSGLGNYNLVGKMRVKKFRFKLTLSISPEKADYDTFYSGGSYFIADIGYEFTKSIGASLSIRPEYDYEYKDDNTDYVAGQSTKGSFYFEKTLNFALIGGEASYSYTVAATENGKSNSKDSAKVNLKFYANKKIANFEVLPSFEYSHYLGEDDDLSGYFTTMVLHIRKRF